MAWLQGFINVYHLPFMWKNRENPAIVAAFDALLREHDKAHDPEQGLWVSFDRIGFMPPKDIMKTDPNFLHWDQNVRSVICGCSRFHRVSCVQPIKQPGFRGVQGSFSLIFSS